MTLTLDYFCYAILLWYEMYMFLQLAAEKSDIFYLLFSKNKYEQAYLAFIVIFSFLSTLCLCFVFYPVNYWVLFGIEQVSHVMKVSRFIVLWYYAQEEMNALDLVEVLSNIKDVEKIQLGRRYRSTFGEKVEPKEIVLSMRGIVAAIAKEEPLEQGEPDARPNRTSSDGLYSQQEMTTVTTMPNTTFTTKS